MKKINIVKKNEDFNRIINKYRAYKSECFIFFVERKENQLYHFGISVSKKLGNAVLRNRYKRIIKDILDKKTYKKGFNCIIILRKDILNKKYSEIEEELLKNILNLELIEELNHEKQ